jgi:hypothetical protein
MMLPLTTCNRTGQPARAAATKTVKPATPDGEAREESLELRQAQFDFEMAERAELQREANVMRDMMLEQLKADDEIVKKYIMMI